jgi:hypothetical protein
VTVYVLRPGHDATCQVVNVTTRGPEPWRVLSPMLLGPVPLYAGQWSRTMENAWQYSKVYPQHAGQDGSAGYMWWNWARAGWERPDAVRYPMGKGAQPVYSLWAAERLGYIAARQRIYIPLYVQAVRFSQLDVFRVLREMAVKSDLVIEDFDAYDHRGLGYSWSDVIRDPDRKMGHGFVLAMMLEGII